jgi:hypothetical protein
MATAGQTLVQLPQEDLQKLLEEVATLRQEVLFLREEREVHQQRLALSDARIHVLEEGQKVTDVSPPTSPPPAHPEQTEPSIEMEEEVESAMETPFTEVRGRYRKRRTSPPTPQVQTVKSGPSREPPSAEAPKKAKHGNPPAPQAQPPRPAPTKPVAQQKPPAESKIPPVIIRDASKWPSISSGMKARHIAFTKAKPCVDGIRVNPGTSDDFRALTLLLEERNVPFHSFALPEAKTLRAVLRTVPVEIGLDDVHSDLVDQGLEPIKVSRMTSTRTKKPLPLVLVEVPKDKGQIFQLKTVCHLIISVERPHKKGTPSQCHKCQRFHHSQRHCHAQPKCVKCGESHESRACQKTRDAAAKCANCGGPHTASYRGCPRFPRGYLGRKTPREAPQNPPKNRTPAPPAAPAKKSPPATAPPKQPVAATTNDPKSFADATATKKPATPTPRSAPPKQNPAIKKVVFDLLDAIQSSSSTEEILKKVLAIIPNLLSNC